jgi:predicted kinase
VFQVAVAARCQDMLAEAEPGVALRPALVIFSGVPGTGKTTLAAGQLQRGQSAILDSVATLERIRAPWRALAVEFGVPLRIVETICSDEATHRARLRVRRRGIPGWPELSWDEAAQVAERFEPWTDARLVLDAVEPLDRNLAVLREYLLHPRLPG